MVFDALYHESSTVVIEINPLGRESGICD